MKAYPTRPERLFLAGTRATRARKRACATDRQKYAFLRANYCVEYNDDGRDLHAISNSRDAADFFRAAWPVDADGVEHLLVMPLNSKNVPIGIFEAVRGGRASAATDISALLRGVIITNALAFIVAHNHPSGDPVPSNDDVEVTRRIAEAGQLCATPLLDHIVLGANNRFTSLLDMGLFKPPHRLSI